MATNLTEYANDLERETKWQKTPMPLEPADYLYMVKKAVKRLYIDTGRASLYNNDLIQTDEEGLTTLTVDLPIDEEAYVFCCAKLNFFQKVATDVNNIVGYTTNAITVTNADKPYSNLKDTMDKLENERRIIFYKMIRYTIATS